MVDPTEPMLEQIYSALQSLRDEFGPAEKYEAYSAAFHEISSFRNEIFELLGEIKSMRDEFWLAMKALGAVK